MSMDQISVAFQNLSYNSSSPISAILKPISAGFIGGGNYPANYPTSIEFVDHLSLLMNLIPNLVRFSITVIFIASFFLPTIQRPIMTLWARVIESDKPVFTLLFGGTAAVAKAIQEIVKVL